VEILFLFLLGLVVSYVGTIPPGTVNLLVLQLGLEGRTRMALRFALAATMVEYPYAWAAVEFEEWITSRPDLTSYLQLFTGLVMIVIGVGVLVAQRQRAHVAAVIPSDGGFRRGLIAGVLNPMTIPFWMAITAYLRLAGWIDLSTSLRLHTFVLGACIGTLLLLITFILLARRVAGYTTGNSWVKNLPGFVLLVLGLHALIKLIP